MNTYRGSLISEEAFVTKVSKATRQIDNAARYKIGDLSLWPEFTQRQVKLAECAQADYNEKYGEMDEMLGAVGGYSIGDVSVSGGDKQNKSALSKHYGICDEAISLLMPTGLLDRRLR